MPRKTRKGTDWVTNPDAWIHQNVICLTVDALGGATPSAPTVLATLTVPPSAVSQPGAASQLYQEDVTAVRVRGQIHWRALNLADTIWGADVWKIFDLRVMRMKADVNGDVQLSPTYDLTDFLAADESFLWHHSVSIPAFRQENALGDAVTVPYTTYGTVDVNIGVQRRLEPNDVLVLLGQLSPTCVLSSLSDVAMTVLVSTRLRVLLRETS